MSDNKPYTLEEYKRNLRSRIENADYKRGVVIDEKENTYDRYTYAEKCLIYDLAYPYNVEFLGDCMDVAGSSYKRKAYVTINKNERSSSFGRLMLYFWSFFD